MMELVNGAARRRCRDYMSPVGGAAIDVNFNNSPGHCSSRDGSFIQDEDMHLILEFGGLFRDSAVATLRRSGIFDAADLAPCKSSPGGASVDSATAAYGAQFDADVVAQLDFDDFSVRRDMARLTFGATGRDVIDFAPVVNGDGRKRRKMLQTSVEVSLFDLNRSTYGGGSLFSSDDDFSPQMDDFPTTVSEKFQNGADLPVKPAFISTDSLDFSSLSITEDNLRQACATNKCDYMLTFDKNVTESGVGAMSCSGAALYEDQQPTELMSQEPDKSISVPLSDVQHVPENSCASEDEHNSNVTTWGRIKRSYERNSCENLTGGQYPKCVSLPDLKPPPTFQVCRLYAGERMASGLQYAGLEKDAVVEQTAPKSPGAKKDTNICSAGGGRLLREFKRRALITDESGYATGDGSNTNPFSNFTLHQQANDVMALQHQGAYTTAEQVMQIRSGASLHRLDDDQPHFEHAEFYVNGRYVDMNHNEIGYNLAQPACLNSNVVDEANGGEPPDPPSKPPRTFTTLLEERRRRDEETKDASAQMVAQPKMVEQWSQTDAATANNTIPDHITAAGWAKRSSGSQHHGGQGETVCGGNGATTAVEVHFLKLPFEVPPLETVLTPFLAKFLGESDPKMSFKDVTREKIQKYNAVVQVSNTTEQNEIIPDPPKLASCQFSSSSNVNRSRDHHNEPIKMDGGPSHVQDWDSLATLLPGDVVQACRFFKRNSAFLRNIDKPDSEQRDGNQTMSSSSGRRHRWRRCSHCVRDIDTIDEIGFDSETLMSHKNQLISVEIELSTSLQKQANEEKLSNLKTLIDNIEKYCHDIELQFRQENFDVDDNQRNTLLGTLIFNSLCPAIESLVTDGLVTGKSICDVMKSSRVIDIATRSVCSMIMDVRRDVTVEGNNGERSLQFAVFVDSLLSSRSLDIWLSDLISDRRLVVDHYSKLAYVSLLNKAGFSLLLDRLMDTVAELRLLPFERVRLIDVEISATSDNANSCETSPTNYRRPITPVSHNVPSTNEQREGVSNFVILQRELRIIFRFPPMSNDVIVMNNDVSMKKSDEIAIKAMPTRNRPTHIDYKPIRYSNGAADTCIPSPSKRRMTPCASLVLAKPHVQVGSPAKPPISGIPSPRHYKKVASTTAKNVTSLNPYFKYRQVINESSLRTPRSAFENARAVFDENPLPKATLISRIPAPKSSAPNKTAGRR